MQIISFDVASMTDFYNDKLALDQVGSLNIQFDNLGYSSLYSLLNFGSLLFIAAGTPILMCFVWLATFNTRYSHFR
jgi:hypothetical protein